MRLGNIEVEELCGGVALIVFGGSAYGGLLGR